MKRLVQSQLVRGGSLLAEVDDPPGGPVIRGIGKDRSTVVGRADESFEDAAATVTPAARRLTARFPSMDNPRDRVGIEPGGQPSAETGAFIAPVADQAKFRMSMTWCRAVAKAEG